MKKILVFLLGIILGSILITEPVNAQTCHYGIPSPRLPRNGAKVSDAVRELTTTASSCLATNMSVLFSNGAFLPIGILDIEASLMESDPPGNADEEVKRYTGKKVGGTLIEWTFDRIVTTGNLDSAGDQKCELYLRVNLVSEDPYNTSYIDADLFRYSMCIT